MGAGLTILEGRLAYIIDHNAGRSSLEAPEG
jgi:hypothetical protein